MYIIFFYSNIEKDLNLFVLLQDQRGMIESWKKIVQTGFMQLEFSQEELKDEIMKLREKNEDFDQQFESENRKVTSYQIIAN